MVANKNLFAMTWLSNVRLFGEKIGGYDNRRNYEDSVRLPDGRAWMDLNRGEGATLVFSSSPYDWVRIRFSRTNEGLLHPVGWENCDWSLQDGAQALYICMVLLHEMKDRRGSLPEGFEIPTGDLRNLRFP